MANNQLLQVEISQQTFDLLKALGDPKDVVEKLASHAADGVRRPGAWESGWVFQCFGPDFKTNLEIDPVCIGKPWINYRTKGTKGQS